MYSSSGTSSIGSRTFSWRWIFVVIAFCIAMFAATLFTQTYLNPEAFSQIDTTKIHESSPNAFATASRFSAYMPPLLTGGAILFVLHIIMFIAMPGSFDPAPGQIKRSHPLLMTEAAGTLTFFGFTLAPMIGHTISGQSTHDYSLALGLMMHRGLSGGLAVAALGTVLYGTWWILTRRD